MLLAQIVAPIWVAYLIVTAHRVDMCVKMASTQRVIAHVTR